MISQRLKTIFAASIPFFIAHGLEENFNGFHNISWRPNLIFVFLNDSPAPKATFIIFQIMMWLALIIMAFLISSERWRLRLMFLPAIIFIVELHHIWTAEK